MKSLIIVSGHCGTTRKAADMLAEKIGGADIFDTRVQSADLDFAQYENFVFGANIRIFMLNFRFSKWARKLKKYYKNKRVFGYLIGANENNSNMLKKFSKKLPNNQGVVYAWGEFAEERATGQTQKMYAEMKADCLQKNKELPHIREEEIYGLAQMILSI